jgi:aspartyl/asparaginyl beta-hydroxylase (cupin superfamily)
MRVYYYIALFIIIIAIVLIFRKTKKNKLFYDINEICPELTKIKSIRTGIMSELGNIMKNNQDAWQLWPEKYLYTTPNAEWKIFPFFAFGIWVDDNCNLCPILSKFLKNIKGLKLATLSKMSPNMKLNPHEGWGKHSNHVIRCHYGLIVPDNCYVVVSETENYKKKSIMQTTHHKENEWMAFDDSKTHYAVNGSNKERVVLILDIERPSDIETGKSTIGDTKELLDIVNYFKQKNIKINT